MEEKYQEILEKIKKADSILIGASNGLAISEGYNIFADDSSFQEHFGEFRQKYGFRNILQGAFYSYPSEEERWAFFSRMYAYFVNNKEASPVMKNLYELVKDKNYFVVTSNTDSHFALAGFQKERLFEIEGNIRYLQCSDGCLNRIYKGNEILSKMEQEQENGKVPSNLIPKCPECGCPMQVHVEVDRSFLRGEVWQASFQAYKDFIEKAHGKRLVVLEFGIGARNQLIKAPLMKLTSVEENASYITFNRGSELYIPDAIASKSIAVDGDIAEVIEHLMQLKQA
ncbi:Sir2 family NAD-dependent protein deacetylase [Psychrobacillus antarcticus]|uniref:Sir2 family NAD-dependent protein deacetylase n=1 Tax=Psychrobacillus antarcticus TaxID=2879115 RepID=UPI0024084A2B|nr:Sir2 family NAD-dependent protein deacetylase [Psychrobacillus antarcticus]